LYRILPKIKDAVYRLQISAEVNAGPQSSRPNPDLTAHQMKIGKESKGFKIQFKIELLTTQLAQFQLFMNTLSVSVFGIHGFFRYSTVTFVTG